MVILHKKGEYSDSSVGSLMEFALHIYKIMDEHSPTPPLLGGNY
jgi:hypothetical protein